MGHYSVMIVIIASNWNIDLRQNLLLWVFTKVEHIVAKRHQRGTAVYFIQWKNYSPAENTWEPAEHLTKELLCIHFVLMNPERASLFYSRGAWNRPFMVNNPIRGSTKNTRGMKPDSSFFNCFPCLQGEGLDSFLFIVNSPLYCFHSWEVIFSKKAFQKWGSNSFGFQNTTKVAGSKTAPPCQMPGRIVTLANSDPTDFQYIFFKYSGSSN